MKNRLGNENNELLAHLSDRFVSALPVRQGKAAELDELMALLAPSAWGVGLEGLEIKAGSCRLVAGCFGAELFFNEKRSGYPEHFRMCMSRCYGHCHYDTATQLAGPSLQRAAVLSQVFIAVANPCDELAWMQARATARAAKTNGAFVLLVAAQRGSYIGDEDIIEKSIANIDPDDVHCVLRGEVEDPIFFLQTFSWALMPALARFARQDISDMNSIRQMLERNHAAIVHVRARKERQTLSDAVNLASKFIPFGLNISQSTGVIVLLDNRDYPEHTLEELVATTKAALAGISNTRVVVSEITDGEEYANSCSHNSSHEFYMIVAFDIAMFQKNQALLAAT
jgi:hypothetical protein